MKFQSGLAALAAAAPLAQAAGSAYIYNNCKTPVYLWAVDATRSPGSPSTIAPGDSYSEQYKTLKSGGVSLKLSKTTSISPITQLEYTLAGGFIWYDGSNVDCTGPACPFYADGIHMETSNPSCPTRTCQPGTDCSGFYINWNDDVNSLSCSPDADVKLYLCSTSASGGSSGGSSGGGSGGTPPTPSTIPTTPTLPSPAAVIPSKAVPAPSAVVSSIHRMEAPAPWNGKRGPPRMLKKFKARVAEINPRDLHSHMRRHNHKRSL